MIVYSYKFICVCIVSFYANITKIGTRSCNCRFTQKKVMSQYKKLFKVGVANGYLSRVLNTITTDKIIMIKIAQSKRPFSTFSFTEGQ